MAKGPGDDTHFTCLITLQYLQAQASVKIDEIAPKIANSYHEPKRASP